MLHSNEENLIDTFISAVKVSLFSYLQIKNPLINAMFTTVLFTMVGILMKYITEMRVTRESNGLSVKDRIYDWFYKRNQITIEGKLCYTNSLYSSASTTEMFSEQFKSVWDHIIHHIYKNKSITEIKEMLSFNKKYNWDDDTETNNEKVLFVVSQRNKFVFCKDLDIYAYTKFSTLENRDEKSEKSNFNTEIIEIVLYSYTSSVSQIKDYIYKIKQEYLQKLEESRNDKKFIYTLVKTKYDDSPLECWDEDLFTTTRSFNNMFFEGKSNVMRQIDFFINNSEWYTAKGIPYTLGIGLHGLPGTGKTSFIKALAHHTNRHLISLSFKTIKTRRQLMQFFFEDRYSSDNKKHSIGFSNKIIVIEDIDAQGDIVLDRSNKKTDNEANNDANKQLSTIINCLIDGNNSDDSKEKDNDGVVTNYKTKTYGPNNYTYKPDDDAITLDDILTLWDGIKETDGRILIISSNHYDKLDPALRRPGRIDIDLEMKLLSRNVIQEIYKHLYGTILSENKLKKIKEYYHSPAEIVNMFTCNKDSEDGFYKAILQKQSFEPTPLTTQKKQSTKMKTKRKKLIVNDNDSEVSNNDSTIITAKMTDDF